MENPVAIATVSLGQHPSHSLPSKTKAAAHNGFFALEIAYNDLAVYANPKSPQVTIQVAAEEIAAIFAPLRVDTRVRVIMFYLAIYSELGGSFKHIPSKDSRSNAAVAMIYIYAIFYGFSWNAIPWIIAFEILPDGVSVYMQWLAQFTVVYSPPHMFKSITFETFYFFGACTLVALTFAYLFVPETKGVPLEEMDFLFGEDVSIFAVAAKKHYNEFKQTGLTVSEMHGTEKGGDALYIEKV